VPRLLHGAANSSLFARTSMGKSTAICIKIANTETLTPIMLSILENKRTARLALGMAGAAAASPVVVGR